jgi:hypothetical protein
MTMEVIVELEIVNIHVTSSKPTSRAISRRLHKNSHWDRGLAGFQHRQNRPTTSNGAERRI